MLANVHREMGLFDEAISGYEMALKVSADQLGVLIAMLLTLSESATTKVDMGMFGRAAELAERALRTAIKIANIKTDVFNLWKAVADVFVVLGITKAKAASADAKTICTMLHRSLQDGEFELLTHHDKVQGDFGQLLGAEGESLGTESFFIAAILASKRAVHASLSDRHAHAIAWYNLGWAEHRAYFSGEASPSPSATSRQRYLKASMKCFKRAIELEAGNPPERAQRANMDQPRNTLSAPQRPTASE